jgi:hypothetical protein
MRRVRAIELHNYIQRLEQFAERCGVPVVRNSRLAGVLGQIEDRRIVLRAGLTLEQQLLTLVHELTHRIVHCNALPRVNRTVCEYEAEAVEKWVGSALKVGPSAGENLDMAATDDLLACSVMRVRWASHVILKVAQEGNVAQESKVAHDSKVAQDSALGLTSFLQPQATVEFDAAAREEVILNDELHGVGNFIRLPQPL